MEFLSHYFLSLLIFLPIVGTIVMLKTRARLSAKWIALGTTVVMFLLSLMLPLLYDWHDPTNGQTPAYAIRDRAHPAGTVQLVQRFTLIPGLGVHYYVGIDGLSLPLVLLTTVICAVVCVASWSIDQQSERYFALVLLAQAGILATLLSLDFALFTLFFVAALVPIGLLIQLRGGRRKESATIKFWAFMVISAIAMLAVLIGVRCCASSFDLIALPALLQDQFAAGGASSAVGQTLFMILMAGLLIRLAVVPLHTWLLDVHDDVPTPISIMLGALVQATGAYGIFRIAHPLFPEAARSSWFIFALLGIGNIAYGALCSVYQADVKRWAAIILIPQTGFILLGVSMMTATGIHGATFMMVSHGITGALLFFLAGMIVDRAHHRDLARVGGLSDAHADLAISSAGLLAVLGLPALCTFVGEVLVVLGVFQAAGPDSLLIARDNASLAKICMMAVLACIGMALNAACTLLVVHRIAFGPRRPESGEWVDVDEREIAVLTPLTVIAILLGVAPTVMYFNFTRTSVEAIHRAQDADGRSQAPAPASRSKSE